MSIVKQVCEGLAEAHRLGIVHRDLKPQNIMVDEEGNARIMDFGIARSLKVKGITGAGVMIGTPEYMSPEQVEGKETDQRSDIYSLGIILYEMLTGRVPFEGDTPFTVGVKHKSEIPKNPKELNAQIPDDLNRLILRCLEKEKEKRYQSAYELSSELSSPEGPSGGKSRQKKWDKSIAVLPFDDLSANKDQEFFCDGIAEEIISSLTKIADLRVVARTSAFSFKGKGVDVREIGQKLNVGIVLEGSVRKADKRLRITADLINVADGYHLWSERYDCEMDDIFAIQDNVTAAIMGKLKVGFLGEGRAGLIRPQTQDAEAYDLYMRARHFQDQRTEGSILRSVDYFKQATQLDPNYALAYVGMANSYILLPGYARSPVREAFPKARAAVTKALEIDEKLAEAHASLGLILENEWQWDGSEKEYQRAIALNPNTATAHHWYADLLLVLGRLEKPWPRWSARSSWIRSR